MPSLVARQLAGSILPPDTRDQPERDAEQLRHSAHRAAG
jgi:hypothetical protein